MMEDLVCPRCKTTKYRNPALKLLVNVCGHALCESCVELLFVKGSGPCPDCGVPLRRNGFRIQLFEDPVVEKEVEIRRRVLRDYCKRESDFITLRDFNDYLEEVETIVFNLVNGIDVVETNKRIDEYKKENKDQIAKVRAKTMTEDMMELETILQEEKQRAEIARIEAVNTELKEKVRKAKNHEALIDDLMFSESDAKAIIALHQSNAKSKIDYQVKKIEVPVVPATPGPTAFTSGIGFGAGRTSFLPVPKVEEAPLFQYEEFILDLGGLMPPSIEELKTSHSSYLSNIKVPTAGEIAGGFHSSIACRRALQDAFADIALDPKSLHNGKGKTTTGVGGEPMDTL